MHKNYETPDSIPLATITLQMLETSLEIVIFQDYVKGQGPYDFEVGAG